MTYSPSTVDSQLILRRQLNWLAVETCLLAVCFGRPLIDLLQFTFHSELFSYIPLIPVISAYLIWTERKKITMEVCPSRAGAAVAFVIGAAIVAAWWLGTRAGWAPAPQDYLTLMMLSFLCFFWGACLALPGWKIMRDAAFPAAFLIFAVPLPAAWEGHIDTFFQYTSAFAAKAFFGLAGTPALLRGLRIDLPGFSLIVAPECSGIHSTLVLLITSLLAGYLFLRRTSLRVILVLSIVPLAILRNGFRVFVIGELCVHISPTMIDSPIHRKGGPIFFALSLIPLFLLLVFLRKRDSNGSKLSGKD
ncbi:MAG TPA: exosortase/archaeosortase family protein [Candidatus Baltobacteraceae bacterium]|jgi:exosortase C (VPDSG-CTERM-specific)|nr:exosortase/archaeosortase family protein [Candidatus Baltobacteraceae bacterium]